MFILAAALVVAGVALFVAAPLGIGLAAVHTKSPGELQVERHEHERALAVQGLRELEFDREMGKLSDADYESMHKALEQQALAAMTAVENLRRQAGAAAKPKKLSAAPVTQAPRRSTAAPSLVLHTELPQARLSSASPSRRIRYCPQCGTRAVAESKFCAQCGVAIKPMGGATAWTD